MGECTVVLVGGNNGGKEHLLQELLGRQGGAWCYSYRHITYDLRLLPLCALQSPALRGADCTVLVTPALDLQRALAALPALWQRSHRLVVYITDRGAARRRGVIIDPAALSAGLGCPVVVATPYSSRGVNRLLAAVDRVSTFSAGAPYPGGYAYPNGTGGSGAPGKPCAHISSVPGVDGGAVRDPVGVGCFALGVAMAFWQGIERFSVLYLRENRSPDILC